MRSGTSVLIAGFAVGLVVAFIGGPKRLSAQVTGIAAGFFIPLFFVTLGAKLDLRAVVDKPSILELTALLTVANLAVHLVAAVVTRQQPSHRARGDSTTRVAGRRRHARSAGARDHLRAGRGNPDRGTDHHRALPRRDRPARAHAPRY